MNQLTNKINNYHQKTNLGYISNDNTKKNIPTSANLFKPNTMYIKLNKISNSKENLIYIINTKVANRRSFDKKLENKNTEFKTDKKERMKNSEKNSFEFESKDEISTNNLTEILYNNSNMNNIEYKNNDVNYLNNKANGVNLNSNQNPNLSTSVNENFIKNNNKKIIVNLNIKKIGSINLNKKLEKQSKNNHKMKHIKVNTQHKKSLHINYINAIKRSINLNLNSNIKKKNITLRKLSNLTEDNRLNIGIGGLLPLKSKTQNYAIFNTNSNYSSYKKPLGKSKIISDSFNQSFENRKTTNDLISSKKKLFIGSHNNIQKKSKLNLEKIQQKKKPKGLKNINLGKSSDFFLHKISAKHLINTASPKNKNIYLLINNNKDLDIKNTKEINIIDNNQTITQETNKNPEICYTERMEKNFGEKELDEIGNKNGKKEKKLNLIIKSDLFISKKLEKNIININGIKSCKHHQKKIKLNKNDLIFPKKKKNSNKNISNMNNSTKKKLNLDLNSNEKNNDKYIQYDIPLINKVHVFEIGKNKISKNNNTNCNLNNSNDKVKEMNNNKRNNFLQNLILNSSDKKNNNSEKNIRELSPNKKELINKINNNIQNITKKIHENKLKDLNHLENYNTTPLDQKHSLKGNYSSTNINESNQSKKNTRNKLFQRDKETNEMETPILLNTARLTEKMLDEKLNLFEKIKNMNTNYNLKKNKNLLDDYSSENSEIIYQEISISSNNKRNTIKNSIKYILFLEKNCIEKILGFLNIKTINILCTINKRCFDIFKPIINKKIKEKILSYYASSPIKYINSIKLFLMTYSPLSKLSPLLLHKKYVDLLLQNNQRYDQEIQKDLTRTVPDDSSFKYGNTNYNKLYHLLTVYSLYNGKIGYAQGINFIAANIIKLMEKEKEENILVFLDGFLQKFDFGKLLGNEKGNFLQKYLDELSNYLDKFCPEISKFFLNANISHEIFSTNWILTLFSNSMDNKYLFIIWDFLIIFGRNFFMNFVICVLNFFKNEILNEKQNNITFFMRNILRNKKFEENFKLIVDKTIDFMHKNYKL